MAYFAFCVNILAAFAQQRKQEMAEMERKGY